MEIYHKIVLDFELHGEIKELVDRLEKIYKEAIKLNENSQKRIELEDKFYSLTCTLEVVARDWARMGKISWKEFDKLYFRYSI